MNILNKTNLRPCTSCQMCAAVCPKEAISISLDNDGFYRPFINENLCIDCSLCIKVCNKFDNNIIITRDNDLNRTKLIAASAKDDNIVNKTTSGGISDLLAKQLIKEGYNVIGVAYDSQKNYAIHKTAKSELDTDKFRGSKYIQSYSVDSFKELVKKCRNHKYAVFGLPCHIYAISKYLERIGQRDNCILIDLYCHGCPSMYTWTKTSDSIRSKLKCNNFINVNWRSKKRGWGSFILEVQGNNEKKYVSSPMHNEFFDLFFSNQVLNESCIDCKLRGTLAYTDIRLGDFWGNEFSKTFRGMSAVSLVTDNGNKIFNSIIDKLNVVEKSYNIFLPFQSWSHTYKIDKKLRKELLLNLKDNNTTITQCVNILRKKENIKTKMTLLIKEILSYFPINIEYKLRKILK